MHRICVANGQRNGRSPRSFHFLRKVILNHVQITEQYCSCLTCNQDTSSDHTAKNPSEDRNRNCKRTRGIPTRKGNKRPNHESQNTDAQGTRAPVNTSTNLPLLTISSQIIERVTSYKLLGVHIDSSLSWSIHIDYNYYQKATARLYFRKELVCQTATYFTST